MALPMYVEPGRSSLEVTPAEYRVLEAFLDGGCSNSVIAVRLQCSEDTVKTHMRHMLQKVEPGTTRAALAVGVLRGHIRVVKKWREPRADRG